MADLLALLDLGSNAARFLLVRITPGVEFRVLRSERVQTRLGGGQPGMLPRAAVDATISAVHGFLKDVRNGGSPRVLAIATAAVRDADNRAHLLETLRRKEGVHVRVLSGRQEARLGALAALRSLPLHSGAIADLGGGSLQLTRFAEGAIVATTSLPLGALRSTRRFFHHDPPTGAELRAARREFRRRLLRVLPPAGDDDELVALGGTIRTLARMHLAATAREDRSRHGLRMRQSAITALREQLQPLGESKRRRVPGLKAERADIILAGAILFEELMLVGGYLALTVCTRGVRDGLLLTETFNGAVGV